MTNLFLKVNKDLFKLGLNPTEILILAQIMEFDTNTGSCFISDKALAEQFGVSEKTISRTIKALEEKGFIVRDTKSAKGGKVRYMSVNKAKLSTTDKMTGDNKANGQNDCCTTDNLTVDNRQNDLIKDNIKDNILKEKKLEEKNGFAANAANPELPAKAANSSNYPVVTVRDLVAMRAKYELIEGSANLVRIISTGKIVKVV